MSGPSEDADRDYWKPNADEVESFWHHTEEVYDAGLEHRLAMLTMGVEAAEALAALIVTDRDC